MLLTTPTQPSLRQAIASYDNIMNWTGGSLQRHSRNAQKSVVNQQRQHFAKVRTALQNGSSTPSEPFRPNYFVEESLDIGGHLSSFGSRPDRHTPCSSHSRRRRNLKQHKAEGITSQIREHQCRDNSLGLPGARNGATASRDKSAHGNPTVQAKMPAPDSGADTENQLLEANRRRLLRQQDWVGLAPSRPVKMHFPSTREKDRIGKRRKIGRHNGHHAHDEQTANITYDRNGHGPCNSGALRDGMKDIRIRVGTDALTSQTSIRQTHHARPQSAERYREDSQDSMLFDAEVLYAAQKESTRDMHLVSNNDKSSAGPAGSVMEPPINPQHDHHLHHVLRHQNGSQNDDRMRPSCQGEASDTDCAQILRNPVEMYSYERARPQEEEVNNTFQIIGGVERRPLRLIFDQFPELPVDGQEEAGAAAVGDDNVDHSSACRQANAGFPELGHGQSRASNGRRPSIKVCGEPLPSIVDDEWFKPVGPTSSSSTTALSHTVQQPAQRGDPGHDAVAWSRHATAGQQTCLGASSPISASLPSVRIYEPGRIVSHVERKRRHSPGGCQSHGIDESERLWRRFVFEDNDELASEAMPVHEDKRASQMSPTSRWDTNLSRPCVAVASSVSSELFPTLSVSGSRHTPCISENVQSTAPQLSSSIASMVPWSQSNVPLTPRAPAEKNARFLASNLQKHTDGVLPGEAASGLEFRRGHSVVTHAALFNDVSHHTFSSATSGSGLDQRDKTLGESIGPASVQRNEWSG